MTELPPSPPSSLSQGSSLAAECALVDSAARYRDLRLRKHADYQRVYKATRKQFSSSMSWFLAARLSHEPQSAARVPAALPAHPGPRVGLTAGKVLGKAHERNRIKRRMREAVQHAIHELPAGVDIILHPKRSVMTMDFGKLEEEILRIFRQAATQTRDMAQRSAQGRQGVSPEPISIRGNARSAGQAAVKRKSGKA